MAGPLGSMHLPDLTPAAPEPGALEGRPRHVYTWEIDSGHGGVCLAWYNPLGSGGARLVAGFRLKDGTCLGVWDTGTGAFVGDLRGLPSDYHVRSLVTYERPSDGRPRIAAGSETSYFCIYDGEDYSTLRAVPTTPKYTAVTRLAVYEEPTSGRARLVTG
jgi:hypothetical protein